MKIRKKEWHDLIWNPITNVPSDNSFILHEINLGEPQKIKKPTTIFVGSEVDMFDEKIPYVWLQKIFDAFALAPQHRYLFTTRNNERYDSIDMIIKPMAKQAYENLWFGKTIRSNKDFEWLFPYPLLTCKETYRFLNIELSTSKISVPYDILTDTNWVIIGFEEGKNINDFNFNHKWVKKIIKDCNEVGVPIFLKNHLARNWEDVLIQEFPWQTSIF